MSFESVLLIGPMGTGKSTLGALISARLGWPRAELDKLRYGYYREAGYRDELAKEIREKGGFLSIVNYWKQFDLYSVERVLAEHPRHVIDFGAGATVYENKFEFQRIQSLFAPYPNVFLILPSPDPDESIRILMARSMHLTGTMKQGFNWHAYFVQHPANTLLAKYIVYTQENTPQQTCDEIVSLVQLSR